MGEATRERTVLERVLEALGRETGLTARVLQWQPVFDWHTVIHPDALVEIDGPKHTAQYAVEVKNVDRFETLQQMRALWPRRAKPPLMIAVPHVTVQAAQRCREMDLYFADTAGNVFLQGEGLHLYVTGRRRTAEFEAEEEGRTTNYSRTQFCFYVAVQAGFAEWDVSRDRGGGASGFGYSRAGDEGTGNSRPCWNSPRRRARGANYWMLHDWSRNGWRCIQRSCDRSSIDGDFERRGRDGQRDWICERTMHCGAGKWQPTVYYTTLNRKRRPSMRTTQRRALLRTNGCGLTRQEMSRSSMHSGTQMRYRRSMISYRHFSLMPISPRPLTEETSRQQR